MKSLKSLSLSIAAAAILAACQTAAPPAVPAPIPSKPSEPAPAPKPGGVTGKTIPAEEAAQLCVLKAVKKFNVGIGDVKALDTRKVDAGWLTTLTVGGTAKRCILSPAGDLRSLI